MTYLFCLDRKDLFEGGTPRNSSCYNNVMPKFVKVRMSLICIDKNSLVFVCILKMSFIHARSEKRERKVFATAVLRQQFEN